LIGVKARSDEDRRRFETDWRTSNTTQINS